MEGVWASAPPDSPRNDRDSGAARGPHDVGHLVGIGGKDHSQGSVPVGRQTIRLIGQQTRLVGDDVIVTDDRAQSGR